MLVIERQAGSAVLIGDDVRIEVRSLVGRKKVKLGIQAPKSVRILREELSAERPNGNDDAHARPAIAGQIKPNRAPTAAAATAPDRSRPRDDFRVFVVEDNPAHAKIIRAALKEAGITRVDVASTGEQALAAVEAMAGAGERPHLILLDLVLPDASGVDVIRAVRARAETKSVPIVMISSSDSDRNVRECIGEGANAFLPKSERFEEFCDRIERAADFWRQTKHVA